MAYYTTNKLLVYGFGHEQGLIVSVSRITTINSFYDLLMLHRNFIPNNKRCMKKYFMPQDIFFDIADTGLIYGNRDFEPRMSSLTT